MKKSLLIVIALLAMASLMAAMALTSATVTNAATIKIVNTQDALVALKPGTGTGNNENTARIVDGNLVFEFGRGKNGAMYGLQKNSEYVWESLFIVTNHSETPIKRYFEAKNVPDGVKIEMRSTFHPWEPSHAWFDITNKKTWDNQGYYGAPDYDVRITVSDNVDEDVYEQLQNMEIILYVEAVD